MFDNYVGAKTQKRPTWATALIAVSIAAHALLGVALVVRSFWVIEKLATPDTDIAFGAPPPPPPPPPGGSSKPKTEKKVVKKVKEPVQPDPTKKPEPETTDEQQDDGVEGGVEGGVVGGVVGGVLGGTIGGELGGTGTAPVAPPKMVQQAALEAQRISGDPQIQPPNDVNVAIRRAGQKVIVVVKMCLTAGGTVSSISVLKSSGFPGYDNRIKTKMREWRYRPYLVNGKAVPICAPITFIYTPSS